MRADKNILIAFILNLVFAVFEFIGGMVTNSVAIISDSIHDIGDSISIGASYFLEKKSKKEPDEVHTYGYMRYSVVGSVVTTMVLLVGSVMVIFSAVKRIFNPVEINYGGMIVFAVFGVVVNFCAAYFTRDGDSLNQKAVNLHMLEDVLGWIVVLAGAVIMKFTDFDFIDPVMSMGVAVFIVINAIKNLKDALDLFLEKAPKGISPTEIENYLKGIGGIESVHHIHVWSLDGINNYATMHVVTDEDSHSIKHKIRDGLRELSVNHVTLEIEHVGEHCHQEHCHIEYGRVQHHHHHHH